jgi:RNA polymerase sigma-70 factor (ECF subfamily)
VDHPMDKTESIPADQDKFSLDALKNGDKAEFAKLVNAYSNRIYHLALRILNDPQQAEDVLQETFLKAFRSIGSFEGRSSVSTWLYRIAANEALMIIRRRKPETTLVDEKDQDDDETTDETIVTDWCCMPEEELLTNESRLFMNEAIQKLSPALRVVFMLRDIDGLSIKETADTLGLSEAAVKTRLLRARLSLREQLSKYYHEVHNEVR